VRAISKARSSSCRDDGGCRGGDQADRPACRQGRNGSHSRPFFGTHDGMEKAYADAKKDVERLQKQLLEPDKPLTKAQAQDLGQQLHTAEATEARRRPALDAVAKGAGAAQGFPPPGG